MKYFTLIGETMPVVYSLHSGLRTRHCKLFSTGCATNV